MNPSPGFFVEGLPPASACVERGKSRDVDIEVEAISVHTAATSDSDKKHSAKTFIKEVPGVIAEAISKHAPVNSGFDGAHSGQPIVEGARGRETKTDLVEEAILKHTADTFGLDRKHFGESIVEGARCRGAKTHLKKEAFTKQIAIAPDLDRTCSAETNVQSVRDRDTTPDFEKGAYVMHAPSTSNYHSSVETTGANSKQATWRGEPSQKILKFDSELSKKSFEKAVESKRPQLNYRDIEKVQQRNINQMNLRFYKNEIQCKPDGLFIDDLHQKWFGKYDILERNHGFIQWLFPIREKGLNFLSQELKESEIKPLRQDKAAQRRLVKSYSLMLDFYGLHLVNDRTGKLQETKGAEMRLHNLNTSSHNWLRVTRILKCLEQLHVGPTQLVLPWLNFLVKETHSQNGRLPRAALSCVNFWIPALRDPAAREKMLDRAHQYRSMSCD